MWVGKCIHCRTPLAVALDGTPIGDVTIEHIVPRFHGGTDELENLALSCGPCNHTKGHREDRRRRDDPGLTALINRLRAERARRLRAAKG
jgi:5-methylcytosine-specific restriction endonuclease McrA